MNLRKNIEFVKKIVDLFDLLVEYRDLHRDSDSSDELKTFYLNQLLVSPLVLASPSTVFLLIASARP